MKVLSEAVCLLQPKLKQISSIHPQKFTQDHLADSSYQLTFIQTDLTWNDSIIVGMGLSANTAPHILLSSHTHHTIKRRNCTININHTQMQLLICNKNVVVSGCYVISLMAIISYGSSTLPPAMSGSQLENPAPAD